MTRGRSSPPRVAWLVMCITATAIVSHGCRTTAPPPPPPPPPVEAPAPPRVEPAPVEVFVKVTGSALNVREGPGTQFRSVGRVKRGERLKKLASEGDWLQVALPGDKKGWVHSKFVVDDQAPSPPVPCPPDRLDAEILFAPPPSFVEGEKHGKVVVEGRVSPQGDVVATKVTTNTTGDDALAAVAVDELKRTRFSPMVHKCRPISFVYVYSRSF